MPGLFPLLVAQNCHGAPVVQKILLFVGIKATDTRTQSKAHGVSIDISAACLKKFLSGQRQSFPNDREAKMSVTQWFQSQAADFYDIGIQKLVPQYDKCLNTGGNMFEK